MNNWKKYSFGFIILILLLCAINHYLYPISLDIYYHLGVAQEFNSAGGFVTSNYNEFAPTGRAQLYPPLFQIILALLLKTGINPIILAKILNIMIFPVFLLAAWLIFRELYNEKITFFILLVLALPYSLFVGILDNIPASICLILIFLAYLALIKERFISCAIALTLALYAHTSLAVINLIALLIYSVINKEYFRPMLKIIISVILLFSPFIIHLIINAKYLGMGQQRDPLEIPWLLYLLYICSLVLLIKKTDMKKYSFWIILSILSLIIAPFYPYRFFSSQGLIPFAIIASFSLMNIFNFFSNRAAKIYPRMLIKLIAFLLIINFTWPILMVNYNNEKLNKKIDHFIAESTILKLAQINPNNNFRLHDVSIYSHHAKNIARLIREHTDENQIFFSNFSIFGQLLSVVSHRANATGMLNEVQPYYKINPFMISRVFVAVRDKFAEKNKKLELLAFNNGFELLKETDIAIIYKNKNNRFIRPENKPAVGFIYIYLIFIIFAGMIAAEHWIIQKK